MTNPAEGDRRKVPLSAYPYQFKIPTRFGDNDMLGHANNVAYSRYIETVVSYFQICEAGVDWAADRIAPVAVEALCRFHRSLSFPEVVHAGLRVGRIGNSSITFQIGLFGESDPEVPAATAERWWTKKERVEVAALPYTVPSTAPLRRTSLPSCASRR